MAFSLNNESISYNDQLVLHSLSFDIKRGEKVALLGKSGSGKSTLIKSFMSQKKRSLLTFLKTLVWLKIYLSITIYTSLN